MKKVTKIIYILLVIITIFTLFNKVYAENCHSCSGSGKIYGRECTVCAGSGIMPGDEKDEKEPIEQVVSGAESFISKGDYVSKRPIKLENMETLSDTIYSTLLVVGIIVAFVIGGILGIKFMIGGIEDQAEVKTALVPYIVGCIVVFGAFAIWKIVVTLLL